MVVKLQTLVSCTFQHVSAHPVRCRPALNKQKNTVVHHRITVIDTMAPRSVAVETYPELLNPTWKHKHRTSQYTNHVTQSVRASPAHTHGSIIRTTRHQVRTVVYAVLVAVLRLTPWR